MKYYLTVFKNFLIISCFFVSCSTSRQAFSQSGVADVEVMKEIEKSLIFDKNSRQQFDFYNKKSVKKNSSSSDKRDVKPSIPELEVVIVDSKTESFDIKEKEKIAYNAVIIGQYEVAIQIYKSLLQKDPQNAYVKFSLASAYQKAGQFKQSKNLYYEILKTHPENQDEIVSNLTTILIEESPKDAIYMLSRLVAQNPNSPAILAQSALAYEKIKNYEQAISMLERAVALDPENVSYQYNLAVIYDKFDDRERALNLYKKVLANHLSESQQGISTEFIKKRIESIKDIS